MAVGSLLFCPVHDPAVAYEMLKERFSGLPLNYPETSEFTIQMNRRRVASTVEGLQINRLSNWNASSITALLDGARHAPPGQGVHWLQAVLDVNTEAENTQVFPGASLSDLAAELAAQIPLLLANPAE